MWQTLVSAVVGFLAAHLLQRSRDREELRRLQFRMRSEEASRKREHRRERLVTAVSNLLATAEPQSSELSYTGALRHTHQAQLLLDPSIPSEDALNNGITILMMRLQEYVVMTRTHPDSEPQSMAPLLMAAATVVEAMRQILREQ